MTFAVAMADKQLKVKVKSAYGPSVDQQPDGAYPGFCSMND